MTFSINSPYLYILAFPLLMMMGSSFHFLRVAGKLFLLLKRAGEPLNEAEQKRLDNLLSSGRGFHFTALILSGILLALSTLDNFETFLAPFGNISFPQTQTALGLYILVIVFLVATDYIILMAYPWLNLDGRRPPFNWFVFGLDFEKYYPIHIWLYFPLAIASVGMIGILNKGTTTTLSAGTTIIAGLALVYFPRTIYYIAYFIERKEDHRGGSATLSIHLLHRYRYFRQFIYTVFIAYPIVSLIPEWKDSYSILVVIAAVVYIVLFFVRHICSIKRIYRWIDRKGLRFGYPIESKHYK